MKSELKVIKLDLSTPLPCSVYHHERGICGLPAFAAYAYSVQSSPPIVHDGQWIIQPICDECARKAAAVYAEN